MKAFLQFSAKNKDGGLTTIVIDTKRIVAVERTLAQGVVLIEGAAFQTTAEEAIRIAKELQE